MSACTAGNPAAYERKWRQVSRRYQVLTQVMVRASALPAVRRRLVPTAARLPRLFGAAVDALGNPP